MMGRCRIGIGVLLLTVPVAAGCRSAPLFGRTPPADRPNDVLVAANADSYDDATHPARGTRSGGEVLPDDSPPAAGDGNVIAAGSLHEIEPPGQRTAWGRWFDRFVGPKRHPLPLTEPATTPEILPVFADGDPFGEI